MDAQTCIKDAFAVMGKEGSTTDGEGFIRALWEDANAHFHEIASFVKFDDAGNPVGIWGAMSDFSCSFDPWQDGFSQGLYLAGAECRMDAEAPAGWKKWVIPAYEYLIFPNGEPGAFARAMQDLEDHEIPLAGAVQEFTCSRTGKGYLYVPIRKI